MDDAYEMPDVIAAYEHDGLKIMLVTKQHTIDQVLEAFDHVLRGSGFFPNGELQYVEE